MIGKLATVAALGAWFVLMGRRRAPDGVFVLRITEPRQENVRFLLVDPERRVSLPVTEPQPIPALLTLREDTLPPEWAQRHLQGKARVRAELVGSSAFMQTPIRWGMTEIARLS